MTLAALGKFHDLYIMTLVALAKCYDFAARGKFCDLHIASLVALAARSKFIP